MVASNTSNAKRTTNLNRSVATRSIATSAINVSRGIIRQRQWPFKVYAQSYGHAYISDHPINGISGVPRMGVDGFQLETGESNLGAQILQRVVNSTLVFYEEFNLADWVDVNNTTATRSGSQMSFTAAEVLQSEIIFDNVVNVLAATITIDGATSVANFTLELSNDDGATFETVTNNVRNVFSSTGQKLKYKITSAGTDQITRLKVVYETA